MPTVMESESQSRRENENASGSRCAKKRRLAEVGVSEESAGPAKRRKESGAGSEGESDVERSGGVRNENTQDGMREKEKKKRRKKKKKVPVVQQQQRNGDVDSSPAKSKPSSSSRTTAPSATLKPNGKQKDKKQKEKEKEKQKEPTPGPSRLARSRSSSPGRDDNEGAGQENGSVTLDSATAPAPSLKGKERAASSPSPHSHSQAIEIAALTNKLDTITQTIFPSLICNICLYLMHRPFLLSPCGHVACLDCLVSWFSREVPGQGQQPHLPQLEEQEQQDEQQDEQIQAEQNQENQPGPDMQLGSIVGMVIPPPPLAIPPPPQLPPLPPAPRPRPLAKRKKTCPQCRARITTRPVEVWFAKDMVASIVRAGLVDLDAVPPSLRSPPSLRPPPTAGAGAVNGNARAGVEAAEGDPWKDIFPNKKDGGRRAREREMLREMRERERMGDRDDVDGGVYRCVDCLHEIWEGVCAECGRVYRGHLPGGGISEYSFSDDDGEGSEDEGEGDTDDDLGFVLGLHPNLRYLSESGSEEGGEGGFYGLPVQVTWTDDEMEPSDASGSEGSGSEGYESSFIDDGEREVVELVGSSDDEGEGDARRRRAGRVGRRSNPYVISSGEEDEESPPPRRLGRRDGGVIEVLSDEDEEGSDDGEDLAAEVAERERELYGDDGSVPSGRLRSGRPETGGGEDSELSDEVVEDGGVDYMDDEDELQ